VEGFYGGGKSKNVKKLLERKNDLVAVSLRERRKLRLFSFHLEDGREKRTQEISVAEEKKKKEKKCRS